MENFSQPVQDSIQMSPGRDESVGSNVPVTHIEAPKGWISLNFRELWEYRDLFYFFIWRDVKVRYKQTILGVSWAIIQPILAMVIFSLFFGRLAKVDSDGLPYPIFNYTALVPWTFFANAVTLAANVLVQNSNMVKKIYFPRLIMPTATVLSVLVDFFLAFLVLLGMMAYYGFMPTVNAIWLPLFLLLALMTALGVSLWLSAMNVQFRDVRYTVPFLLQAWMFATPVVYSSNLLSEKWRVVYGLNPMASVVEGFRWALLGTSTKPGPMFIVSMLATLAIFVSGLLYFRRMEKTFADVV